MKRVIVSVINDLVTDQRVNKVCTSLSDNGFEVILIGRRLKNSMPMDERPYKTIRMNLFFTKGALFYAFFNLRLFFFLLFTKADILHSNDLDTLLPNYLVSKIKSKKLVYDSHEIFCEVPELKGRYSRKVWEKIEKWIFPKLKYVFTVNTSIANWFDEKYGVRPLVIRNIPKKKTIYPSDKKEALGIAKDKKIVLMQGAGINIQRGAEEAVEAMQYLANAVLLIVGGGDVIEILKSNVAKLGLENKVIFIPKQNHAELLKYTTIADLGLSIDKDTNINYRFSLPNKVFDYIHAYVPVLVSKLPEIMSIVETYDVGVYIESHNPEHIAEKINYVLENNFKTLKQANLHKAANELVWENEEENLMKVYSKFN